MDYKLRIIEEVFGIQWDLGYKGTTQADKQLCVSIDEFDAKKRIYDESNLYNYNPLVWRFSFKIFKETHKYEELNREINVAKLTEQKLAMLARNKEFFVEGICQLLKNSFYSNMISNIVIKVRSKYLSAPEQRYFQNNFVNDIVLGIINYLLSRYILRNNDLSSILYSIYEMNSQAFKSLFVMLLDTYYLIDDYSEIIFDIVVQFLAIVSKQLTIAPEKKLELYFGKLTQTVNFLIQVLSTHSSRTIFMLSDLGMRFSIRKNFHWQFQNKLITQLFIPSLIDNISIQTAKNFLSNETYQKQTTCFEIVEQALDESKSNFRDQANFELVVDSYTTYLNTVAKLLKLLLKDTDEIQDFILQWLTDLIAFSKNTNKISHMHSLKKIVINSAFSQTLYCLQNKIFFPAVQFNIAYVCLTLVSPITPKNFQKIEFSELFAKYNHQKFKDWVVTDCLLSVLANATPFSYDEAAPMRNSIKKFKFTTAIFAITFILMHLLLFPFYKRYITIHFILKNPESIDEEITKEKKNSLFYEIFVFTYLLNNTQFLPLMQNFLLINFNYIENEVLQTYMRFNKTAKSPTVINIDVLRFFMTIEKSNLKLLLNYPIEYLCECSSIYTDCVLINESAKYQAVLGKRCNNFAILSYEDLFFQINMFFMSININVSRNSSCRLALGTQMLEKFIYTDRRFSNISLVSWQKSVVIEAIVITFVNSQEFEKFAKIDLRVSLLFLLDIFIESDCKEVDDCFLNIIKMYPEKFEQFILFYTEFLSWSLDEGISLLTEIKIREKKESETVGTNAVGNIELNADLSSDLNNISSNELQSEANQDREVGLTENEELSVISERCTQMMHLTNLTLLVFTKFSIFIYEYILKNSVLLPQVLLCLNSCLCSLIGPKSLALKVSNFEKYYFKPRQLLQNIISIYCSLYRSSKEYQEQFLLKLKAETRFFSTSLLSKAIRIAKRENMCLDDQISTIQEIHDDLVKNSNTRDIAEIIMDEMDVPEEYVDPLMQTLISDPVYLPTSNLIMDRHIIERHLITEKFDPFNRKPLKKTDLQARPELKKKIARFIEESKKKLNL